MEAKTKLGPITRPDCPCANKLCPFWGRCKECRKAMAKEGVPPVCEQ